VLLVEQLLEDVHHPGSYPLLGHGFVLFSLSGISTTQGNRDYSDSPQSEPDPLRRNGLSNSDSPLYRCRSESEFLGTLPGHPSHTSKSNWDCNRDSPRSPGSMPCVARVLS
jgi:hypothetical protein